MYGLYNLVAGVVAMLSFLNNSMTVSTQRFMSVAMGEKNEEKINSIYNTSFLLHLLLGLLVVVAFETIGLFAIDRLNIIPERVWCAKIIYQLLIFSTFAKIVSVPFDALVNAKEDMLPFSVIELIDSVLMLAVALSIAYISGDKLIYYGACVAFISVLTFFMKYGWCRYAYKDYCIQLNTYRGKFIIKEMVGWMESFCRSCNDWKESRCCSYYKYFLRYNSKCSIWGCEPDKWCSWTFFCYISKGH